VSVTTALQAVSKAALIPWAANLAADAALEELPRLVKASRTRACGNTTTDERCGVCKDCMRRWVAHRHYAESHRGRERGSKVHDVIEWWALHGEIRGHDDDIAPWVGAFRRFVHDLKPEVFVTETTVINREHRYAGTLDLGLTITSAVSREAAEVCGRYGLDRVRLYVDTKTTRKRENRFYPEWALQVGGGYRHAEAVLLPDGIEEPLPTVDGAAILLLRPDGYALRPVVANDMTFAAFLCALNLYLWVADHGAAATQVKSFPKPAAPALTAAAGDRPVRKTPTKRTAPAKRATARQQTAKPAAPAPTTAQRLGLDPFASATSPGLADSDIPF
jgi:hypothetical protein